MPTFRKLFSTPSLFGAEVLFFDRILLNALFFVGNSTITQRHFQICPTNSNETIVFDTSIYTIVSEVRLVVSMSNIIRWNHHKVHTDLKYSEAYSSFINRQQNAQLSYSVYFSDPPVLLLQFALLS